jgi:hypothetical protein
MAVFAIKVGISLTTPPQTTFSTQAQAMDYARRYALTNNQTIAIIGTSLTSFTWKYQTA